MGIDGGIRRCASRPAPADEVAFVLLVAALALQFRARKYVAWIYWLAVDMVAIFGTMVADGMPGGDPQGRRAARRLTAHRTTGARPTSRVTARPATRRSRYVNDAPATSAC
jgi:hypothetical protein